MVHKKNYCKSKQTVCLFAFLSLLLLSFLSLASDRVYAGFLDMPEIEEVPEAENDVLLKDLDVPNVNDRIRNPEAGPRLNVTAFRIQGIVEYPELGITREKLIKLVEDIRYDMMNEGDLLYSGYTLEELSQLEDLIVDIEKDTRDQHVTPLDVQRLVFLVRDQRRQRGVTLGMLETVADQITDYYRQRGFFLAKAFVPEQRVRDGIVTLTLLLGYLGEAPINNNKLYSQKVVDNIFKSAYGQPVTTDGMEEKLYYLNDMPGLSVQGFFAPGEQVGDTKLNINVLRERRYDVNLRVDNHGSDVTGEYRLYSDLMWNNPLKYGDRLQVSLLAAAVPEQSNYGSVVYGGPLFHYRWGYDVGYSRNAFSLALEQSRDSNVNIGGFSSSVDMGIHYKLSRGRIKNSSLEFSLSRVVASLRYQSATTSSEFNHDVSVNADLAYRFDILREKNRSVHTGSIRLRYSEAIDSLQNQIEDLNNSWIFAFDYTTLRFVKMPFMQRDLRLVLRTSGQISATQLLSVNQFALAGPTRSRAYKTNTFFGDDGLHVGADMIFESLPLGLWKEYVQPFLFLDGAYGVAYLPRSENGRDHNSAEMVDAGFGLKITPMRGVRGNLSVAAPLQTKISNDLDIEEVGDWKVYLDFQYSL